MEESASWFLLTQAGQIMVSGPMTAPHKPEAAYKKLIPLFSTGLYDSKGVEIYEGDIIEFLPFEGSKHFLPMPVFWDKDYCGFKTNLRAKDSDDIPACFGKPDYCVDPKEVKVIGNIYENPELLKKN
jgi:uncharacterized phage protein (TIGR01671 family)